MNTLPPVEALTGKNLNTLVDQVMLKGVDSKAPKPELLRQFAELVYINKMMEEGEVRMDMDERTALWKMMRCLKEAIEAQPRDEVVPVQSAYCKLLTDTSQQLWLKNLIEETLNQ